MGNSAHVRCGNLYNFLGWAGAIFGVVDFAFGRDLDLFVLLILLLVLLARRMFLPQEGKFPRCRRHLQGATLELIDGVATWSCGSRAGGLVNHVRATKHGVFDTPTSSNT